jgi:DNA-binding beta-propeller fold protein YncE
MAALLVVGACALAGGTAPGASAAAGDIFQFGASARGCVALTSAGGLCTPGLAAGSPGDVAITADGKSVYTTSTSDDAVVELSRNTTTGVLTPGSCVSRLGSDACAAVGPSISGPSAVAISPNGKSVYVTSTDTSALTVLDRNTLTGDLTFAACFTAGSIPGCAPVRGLDAAFDVAVTADAKSVYVASAGGGLVAFSRNVNTGALTQGGCFSGYVQGCTPARGADGALGVAVSPDNKSVYLAGSTAGQSAITIFKRNPTTLAITQPAGTAGCLAENGAGGTCDEGGRHLDSAIRLAVTADSKSLYVTATPADEGYLLSFSRNTTTGALTRTGCLGQYADELGCAAADGLSGAVGVTPSKDNKSVYVATQYFGGSIVHLSRNTTTGALTKVDCFAADLDVHPTCRRPVGLDRSAAVAVSADGKSAYASSSRFDAILAFARSLRTVDPGRLTQLDQPPAGCVSADGTDGTSSQPSSGLPLCTEGDGLDGAAKVVVSKDAKSVYVASVFDGAIASFARNTTTGLVTQIGCVAETAEPGCVDSSGLGHIQSLAISPDNTSVYTGSLDRDAVTILARNTTTGALTPAGCIAETGGTDCADATGLVNPEAIEVSPNSKNVYVASDGSDALTTFSRNVTTGALTQTGCFSLSALPGCTQLAGMADVRGVAVSPDAKTVYTVSPEYLRIFSRNLTTGALTPAGCVTSFESSICSFGRGLRGAGSVEVSPDNQSVYTVSHDGAVGVFRRNTTSGALTQPSGSAGCLAAAGFNDASCAPARAIDQASTLVVSPDNKSVYVGADYSGIAVLSRVTAAGATHGNLSQAPGAPGCVNETAVDGCAEGTAVELVFGLAVSPNSRNLYSAAASSDALGVFSRSTT